VVSLFSPLNIKECVRGSSQKGTFTNAVTNFHLFFAQKLQFYFFLDPAVKMSYV
jgi:hypothetical protein